MIDKNALKFADMGQAKESKIETQVAFDATLEYEIVADKDIKVRAAGGINLKKDVPLKVGGILAKMLVEGSENISLYNKAADIAQTKAELEKAELAKIKADLAELKAAKATQAVKAPAKTDKK